MNKKFEVELCSDLQYEQMVADLSYENRHFAIISQENGKENMEIELLLSSGEIKLELDDFVQVITFAKERLASTYRLAE